MRATPNTSKEAADSRKSFPLSGLMLLPTGFLLTESSEIRLHVLLHQKFSAGEPVFSGFGVDLIHRLVGGPMII
jgi:hypothetical protein